MKANKKLINEIAKQIETRINTPRETEREIETYHVQVIKNYEMARISVVPNNGDTLYCIDRLMLVAQFYGISHYVTISDGKLAFEMYSIY